MFHTKLWRFFYWLLRNHGFHSWIDWDFLGHDSNDKADFRAFKSLRKFKYHGSIFRVASHAFRLYISLIVMIIQRRFILGCESFFEVIKLLYQCAILFFATCFAYGYKSWFTYHYFIYEKHKHIQSQNLIRPCTSSIRRNSLLSESINFGRAIRCQTNIGYILNKSYS